MMAQVMLHFVTSAGGESIAPIIQLVKDFRVSGVSERTLGETEVRFKCMQPK